MGEFTLTTSAARFGRFTEARVSMSLEDLCRGFELHAGENTANPSDFFPITDKGPVELRAANDLIATGYLDKDGGTYGRLDFAGRSMGDLVDCSAVHGTGEFADARLIDIALALASPFGVAVVDETGGDAGAARPFERFTLQEGESPFRALERAARQRGVLLTGDARGRLVIYRVGARRYSTAIARRNGLRSLTWQRKRSERFSDYIVKGQTRSGGLDPEAEVGKAFDPGVGRYRPKISIAEQQGEGVNLAAQAEFERNVRFGRSLELTARIGGLRLGGAIPEPGVIVPVVEPLMKIDTDLLIKSALLVESADDAYAELGLIRKEAYQPEPVPQVEGRA